MHVFLHFGTFGLKILQLILASKLSELKQFENFAANSQIRKQKRVKMAPKSNCYHQALKMCLWVGWCCPGSKIEFQVGSVFLSSALGRSLLLKNGLFLLNFAFNKKIHGNFIFLANGYILGKNSRNLTPLKIPFYCQDIITLPINTFFNA